MKEDYSLTAYDLNKEALEEVAVYGAKKGVEMMDASVSGGQEKAKSGTLAIMVGGKEEIFNQCKAILEVMGKPVLV